MERKFASLKKEVENCKKIFGFELTDTTTNEPTFQYIQIDWDKGTFSAFGQTIDLDEDFSLDGNLEALYEKIMESGQFE